MRKRAIISALAVILAGTFLHFAWRLSGRNPIVAVVAGINESTWEHLKMAFWPALLLAPIQWKLYGPLPGFLPGTVVRTLLSPLLIVLLFYGYTALLGNHFLPLDLATFVVSVCAAEYAGHSLMTRNVGIGMRTAAGVTLALATVAFSTLSFRAPDWFLFTPPGATRTEVR